MSDETTHEDPKPQHLHLITSRFNWDWRRENPVEILILVFALTFFFFLPRAGCGVTPEGGDNVSDAPGASASAEEAAVAPVE